eukprot:Skav210783  [mRNA]  locus=scaffold275:38997:52806:+ [translate_table: standard]
MGMGSFLAVSRASNLGARLIHLTYSPGSMIEMMKFDMGGSASTLGAAAAIAQLKPKDCCGQCQDVGIPIEMRVFLTMVIFVPRLVLDTVILFLGCDMGDLILNAVALEFLLVLNSLVLQALVPAHGVNGLERTKVLSSSSRHESAVMALLATLSWALFASCWCISYVYFVEDVLPDYQWDVHAVCNAWQNAILRFGCVLEERGGEAMANAFGGAAVTASHMLSVRS